MATTAQNVGLGATTPLMNLHIRGISDSTILLLENGDPLSVGSNVGLYFRNANYFTGAIKTTGAGTNTARLGFYTFAGLGANGSSLRERISILDNGQVGINNTNPEAMLDVSGTIKISGGNPGSGKVLTSNANGLASWQPLPDNGNSCFQNLKEIGLPGTTNWTVPAGVTKIWVEMWGSGGNGSANTFPQVGGGGGAGAYASFFVTVTPGSSVTVSVTSGNDNYTQFSYGGDYVRTGNGENGYQASGGGRGGFIIRGGVSFSLNAFYSSGEAGENSTYGISEDNTGTKTAFFRGGRGGNAYKGSGGNGEVWAVAAGSGYFSGINRGLADRPVGYGSGGGARTHSGISSPVEGALGGVLIYY
ncbi:MAG: hypothetical protein MUF24_04725 [Chitinophagaceae bacterium]|nr:hypothetical protein [Chitinophagaceae bacterium]